MAARLQELVTIVYQLYVVIGAYTRHLFDPNYDILVTAPPYRALLYPTRQSQQVPGN